jgi:hypothetical protein
LQTQIGQGRPSHGLAQIETGHCRINISPLMATAPDANIESTDRPHR